MTFYMSVTILIVILMIAMTIHVCLYNGFNRNQKIWFATTFQSIVFCAVAEFAVHQDVWAYNPAFKIPLTILTVLQFSIAPCLAMLFTGALGLKNQGYVAIVLFGLGLTIETVFAPFGLIFKFTETGYERGPLFYYLYGSLYFGSLIYLIVFLIIVGKKFHHRDSSTIIAILVVLVAGLIPMTVSKNIHAAYAAVAISSCLCYVYYNDLVQLDTRSDLLENQQRIIDIQTQITARLANLIESRDTETGGHVARTSEYVKTLSEDAMADGIYSDVIDKEFIELIYTLAPIHDVGKILVSDKILRKPGKLTTEEYEEMKKHASMGGVVARKVLSGIVDEKHLNFAYDIATYHHERWSGGGYPKGIAGEEIPLSARIMAIADVFDALVSKRCYKEAMSVEEAFKIIEEESGTHFDPKLVEVFLKCKEKYAEINSTITDKEIKIEESEGSSNE